MQQYLTFKFNATVRGEGKCCCKHGQLTDSVCGNLKSHVRKSVIKS